MKIRIKYWLRWLAVIPGAIIAALLSTFLLRLILTNTLRHFVEPYPELPERLLTPFAISSTFIWVACEIAPEYKLRTGIVFFSVSIFLTGGFLFTALTGGTWFGEKLVLQYVGIPPILGIVGAFIGLYLVKRKLSMEQGD